MRYQTFTYHSTYSPFPLLVHHLGHRLRIGPFRLGTPTASAGLLLADLVHRLITVLLRYSYTIPAFGPFDYDKVALNSSFRFSLENTLCINLLVLVYRYWSFVVNPTITSYFVTK